MAKGVVIYTDGTYECKDFPSYTDLAGAVEGYIEALPLHSLKGGMNGTIYINEEGKLKSLHSNRVATLIAWLGNGLHPLDTILGNMVIVGAPNSEGEDTDIHNMWLELTEHHCENRNKDA
jgi:hypothetical protein